ncbi:MAG: C1 family peptidase [Nitrospirae bacterium]|nr:C1 family peptidase [Nitrospirota bacterium]
MKGVNKLTDVTSLRRRTTLGLAAVVVLLLISTAYADEQLSHQQLNAVIGAAGAQWEAGETPHSALSSVDRQSMLGLIEPDLGDQRRLILAPLSHTEAIPSSLDWRNYNGNWVTSVKNQGNCGSCWAFATTAAIESYILRKNNTQATDTDMSEQVVVSCSGAGSCNGGYINYASDFLRNTGTPVESCYAYTAKNGTCSSACTTRTSAAYTIPSWRWVTTTTATVDTLKNAIYTYGPLVTTFRVYSDFYYYKSGIYSNVSGSYVGNHAVLLVGYNDTEQSFIAKNSWGTGFGESGYFRIAYSQVTNSVGFGLYTIAYPNTGTPPTPTTGTLTVYKYGSGSGSVTPSSGTIAWSGTTGTATYADNTSVTLTATPESTSEFYGWTGCDSVTGNQCTVKVPTAGKKVIAQFIKKYKLTVTKSNTGADLGTVTPSTGTLSWSGNTGTGQYSGNTVVTLVPSVQSGAIFSNWSGCNAIVGNKCTITMSSDRSVTAVFIKKYLLTVIKSGTGSGKVTLSSGAITWNGNTGTASVGVNNTISLYASPATGSKVSSWSGCDSYSGSKCVVTMSQAKNVTVTFNKK